VLSLIKLDIEALRIENIVHTFALGCKTIDVKVAWGLDGEEMRLPFRAVKHVLEEWSWEGRSPLEAGGEDPHWSLILEAELCYPIIVTQEPLEKNLTVVDGRHRVVKAWLLGEKFIAAKFIDYEVLRKEAAISEAEIQDQLARIPDLV